MIFHRVDDINLSTEYSVPSTKIMILGDYSDRVPPLPIPNREVKPISADGTALSGRVGRRRFSLPSPGFLSGLFYLYTIISFDVPTCS